jgi:anaerobic dimethyl sulfoxide reductase subunit B (iron-sulfur subunit)
MQKGFFLDLTRCTACYACVVACKDQNDIEAGPVKWRRVVRFELGRFPNVSVRSFSLACMHCGKPPCVESCPTGTIKKRENNGIVVVDNAKCIGCRTCFLTCPFGAPQFNTDGRMEKCDYCLERTEQGLEPACVQACPARAISSGTIEELVNLASRKAAKRLLGATDPSFFIKTD